MGGKTPLFNHPKNSFMKALKWADGDHPMMSIPSPYSSEVQLVPIVAPCHTRECEW
jgi:hypothetical protein